MCGLFLFNACLEALILLTVDGLLELFLELLHCVSLGLTALLERNFLVF